MKIIPNQDFKDNGETYLKGQEYEVPAEDAEYFTACGWVGERTETTGDVSLDIQDGQLGHTAEVN